MALVEAIARNNVQVRLLFACLLLRCSCSLPPSLPLPPSLFLSLLSHTLFLLGVGTVCCSQANFWALDEQAVKGFLSEANVSVVDQFNVGLRLHNRRDILDLSPVNLDEVDHQHMHAQINTHTRVLVRTHAHMSRHSHGALVPVSTNLTPQYALRGLEVPVM